MTTRLHQAARFGCRLVVTETGEPVEGKPNSSYHNMLGVGFERLYRRANYVPVA